MTRDEIIIAFAKLKAHGYDAEALLLSAGDDLPSAARAAYRRDVKAVARLFAETCPGRASQPDRPPAEERTTRVTARERAAMRRYFKNFQERLTAHLNAR